MEHFCGHIFKAERLRISFDKIYFYTYKYELSLKSQKVNSHKK